MCNISNLIKQLSIYIPVVASKHVRDTDKHRQNKKRKEQSLYLCGLMSDSQIINKKNKKEKSYIQQHGLLKIKKHGHYHNMPGAAINPEDAIYTGYRT